MSKHKIETSIDIEAGTDAVWQVLMDFSTYPEWNPFIRSIEGHAREGERLSVLIQPPGQGSMRFRPRVQTMQAQRAFGWLGSLGIPRLFDGHHEFALEAVGRATRLHHRESFSGILVPLLWNKMQRPTHAGFEAMNQAIKQRAESKANA